MSHCITCKKYEPVKDNLGYCRCADTRFYNNTVNPNHSCVMHDSKTIKMEVKNNKDRET